MLDDFHQFLNLHNINYHFIPADSYTIALYVAHLYRLGRQYTTIRSCISALSFVHKLGDHEDPTNSFLVSKTLQGISKSSATRLSRLPITKPILGKILHNIPYCTPHYYDQVMFKALFLLSFYACLRAGEAVHSGDKSHTLQVSQFAYRQFGNVSGYEIQFCSYKHSSGRSPIFNLLSTGDALCPVKAIHSYLKIRGNFEGPIFCTYDQKPLKRTEFSHILKETLEMAGFNSSQYNTHSFRIGRVTEVANTGASDLVIKNTGRWKSTAYQGYIRPGSFDLPL